MKPWQKLSLRVGAVVAASALALVGLPAQAAVAPAAEQYGGFLSGAEAAPFSIEIFEEALPIPVEPDKPQLLFNFSYTKVLGETGPSTAARSSTIWPGPAIGDGLPTILDQFGLPAEMFPNGYPIVVDAAYDGENVKVADEPFPGIVQKVEANGKKTLAQAGYSLSGNVGEPSSSTKKKNPFEALLSGDFMALPSLLFGGSGEEGTAGGPLGALSVLVDADGFSSRSITEYDGETVTAKSVSRMGQLRLLSGLITLDGVETTAKVVATVAGAKPSHKMKFGGISLFGQAFGMSNDGIEVMGQKIPIPGLSNNPLRALKALGIGIEVAEPVITEADTNASIEMDGIVITIDTNPLLGMFPKLPLGDLFNLLPTDMLPEQLQMMTSLLPALLGATPKMVFKIGSASAFAGAAEMYSGEDFEAGPSEADSELGGEGDPSIEEILGDDDGQGGPGFGDDDDIGAVLGDGGDMGGAGMDDLGAGDDGGFADGDLSAGGAPRLSNVSAAIPIPGLKDVPLWMVLLGLGVAIGLGRYIGLMGGSLFGGAAACTHGLATGIPDLRKV